MARLENRTLTVDQEEIDRLRAGWRFRLLEAAEDAEKRNPADPLYRILGAALFKATAQQAWLSKDPPWCGPSAIVTEEGLVVCNFVAAGNRNLGPTAMCSLEDLVGNLRNLCEAIHFGQAEVDQVFAALREWITHDNRPDAKDAAAARLDRQDV